QRKQQGTQHAVEARIYAEDPAAGFLPSTGRLIHVRWPERPGIRVDAGYEEGDVVTRHYDPLLAKVIAVGDDRGSALRLLASALAARLRPARAPGPSARAARGRSSSARAPANKPCVSLEAARMCTRATASRPATRRTAGSSTVPVLPPRRATASCGRASAER